MSDYDEDVFFDEEDEKEKIELAYVSAKSKKHSTEYRAINRSH